MYNIEWRPSKATLKYIFVIFCSTICCHKRRKNNPPYAPPWPCILSIIPSINKKRDRGEQSGQGALEDGLGRTGARERRMTMRKMRSRRTHHHLRSVT
jgi:hypothetical protein